MDGPGSARRLLGVFAHPDDEVLLAAAVATPVTAYAGRGAGGRGRPVDGWHRAPPERSPST